MLPSIHPFVCPSIHPYIASIKYFSITIDGFYQASISLCPSLSVPASLPSSIRTHGYYRLVWEWCVGVLFVEPKVGTERSERERKPKTLEPIDTTVAELAHFSPRLSISLGPPLSSLPSVCQSLYFCLCLFVYLYFPTSLCGVLVFRFAPAASASARPAASQLITTSLITSQHHLSHLTHHTTTHHSSSQHHLSHLTHHSTSSHSCTVTAHPSQHNSSSHNCTAHTAALHNSSHHL